MAEVEKEHGLMYMITEGIGYISKIISASIFPPISDGAEMIMKNIENRIILIEKRFVKKIFSFLVIGFGVIFLIFALFFFLIEYLGWSKAAAYFAIGIVIFVIGLLLKVGEHER